MKNLLIIFLLLLGFSSYSQNVNYFYANNYSESASYILYESTNTTSVLMGAGDGANDFIIYDSLYGSSPTTNWSDYSIIYIKFTINSVVSSQYSYTWNAAAIGFVSVPSGGFNTNLEGINTTTTFQFDYIDSGSTDLESLFNSYVAERDSFIISSEPF